MTGTVAPESKCQCGHRRGLHTEDGAAAYAPQTVYHDSPGNRMIRPSACRALRPWGRRYCVCLGFEPMGREAGLR